MTRGKTNKDKTKTSKLLLWNRLFNILDRVSKWIAIMAFLLSIFTLINTNYRADTLREKEEKLLEIEESSNLQITNNTEYFDYIVKRLYTQLASKAEKFQNQLWDVAYDITNKKSGAAIQTLNELEGKLSKFPEFFLLRNCAILRNYYVNNRVVTNDDRINMISDLNDAIETGADLQEYGVIVGITYYFLNDIVSSIHALKTEGNLYDIDSQFYDVSNYWLALISIKIRSNICNVSRFLETSFNINSYTNILKSSISFLFNQNDSFGSVLYLYKIENNQLWPLDVSWCSYQVDHSVYLNPDDKYPLYSYISKSSQEYLYKLYSMIKHYDNWIFNTFNKSGITLDDLSKQYELLENFLLESDVEENYLLSPYLDSLKPNPVIYYCIESRNDRNVPYDLNMMYEYGISSIIPFDLILSQLYYSHLRITTDFIRHAELMKAFKEGAVISEMYEYCSSSEQSKTYIKSISALLLLEYCSKETMIAFAEENSLAFDIFEAAQTAYEYGFRNRVLYIYLLEYWESSPEKLEQLHSEMQILGYSY